MKNESIETFIKIFCNLLQPSQEEPGLATEIIETRVKSAAIISLITISEKRELQSIIDKVFPPKPKYTFAKDVPVGTKVSFKYYDGRSSNTRNGIVIGPSISPGGTQTVVIQWEDNFDLNLKMISELNFFESQDE